MAGYSSFTFEKIRKKFNIKSKRKRLFNDIKPIEISDWLKNFLTLAEELSVKSEKARSEFIVVPMLIELRELNNKYFTIYSGDNLNADADNDLKGECDFMLAKETGSADISLPIFQLLEAKKHDIDEGLPQCSAQMIGAKVYNEKHDIKLEKIYGCVTNGDDWQFLKLENNEIIVDTRKYYLGNIGEVLGVFQQIIDYYKKTIG